MNIAVIGLGSMGQRRIRLIKELYPQYSICGVDSRLDRRNNAEQKYRIKCYDSLGNIGDEVKCAFVCTSPLSHSAIITKCLMRHWNVFTELNLVDDGYEQNMELARQNNCKLFLSSTFLYREEISYIRNKITEDKKWNYIYHVGQYLPDWHPWENYKDFFISDKRTNGCREIMAIELPWLTKTFGQITDYTVVSDKLTNLDINYNDNYMIQFVHENGNKGILVVDVVSPWAVRRLEIYGENRYFQWSGTPDTLQQFDFDEKQLKSVVLHEEEEHCEGYQAFVVENAYKNEIKDFFDVVLQNKTPLYSFEQDQNILHIIDSLEKIK